MSVTRGRPRTRRRRAVLAALLGLPLVLLALLLAAAFLEVRQDFGPYRFEAWVRESPHPEGFNHYLTVTAAGKPDGEGWMLRLSDLHWTLNRRR